MPSSVRHTEDSRPAGATHSQSRRRPHSGDRPKLRTPTDHVLLRSVQRSADRVSDKAGRGPDGGRRRGRDAGATSAAGGGRGALGKSANSSSARGSERELARESVQDRRSLRYVARSWLWTATRLERVRDCGRTAVLPGGSVMVKEVGGSAGFGGVATCGSCWVCPVCSAKIAARRALEVAQAVRWAEDQGGCAVMATFTVQHVLGDPLQKCWDAVAAGWTRVWSGRAARRFRERYGLLGWVRVVEVMRGDDHGWHVHVHALLLLDRPVSIDTAEAIGGELYGRWSAGVGKAGMTCIRRDWKGRDVGVSVVLAERDGSGSDLGDYFVKATYRAPTEALALEMTHGLHTKSNRGGDVRRRSPMKILQDLVGMLDPSTGELLGQYDPEAFAGDLALWHEYERVSKGRRQLTWSRGLKDAIGVEDRTDEEIAEEEIEGETFALLPPETWRKIRRRAYLLLDAVENFGREGGLAWLDREGLTYERVTLGT